MSVKQNSKKMIKVGSKVKVTNNGVEPFTGKLEMVIKWENPFGVFKKKGVDYVVRADDDGKKYRCPEEIVTKLI